MAKYDIVELKIKNGELEDLEEKSGEDKDVLTCHDVVYIYRASKSQKVYIGQTIHFIERHYQHYKNEKEKFTAACFDQVIVIYSQYFNGSALDDVESQLITYFKADRPKSSSPKVGFDMNGVLNRTGGNGVNDYAGREKVALEVILPLWKDVLYKKGWVATETIDGLRSKALVKYSPIKALTNEQGALIREILDHPDVSYVINGDAGTGKTVLLTHLTASVLKERPDARIGVVVQPNWEKTGEEIFKVYGMYSGRLSVLSATKLITSHERYDVIIVDEAHKMSRRYGKQQPSFNTVYEGEFSDCDSHLEILQHMGTQIILMYDVFQAIRPANITREKFQSLTAGYEKRFLTTQFRIQARGGKRVYV